MYSSGGQYAGSRGQSSAAFQWQPTLTAHDPNPPLPIETAAGGGTTYTYSPTGGIQFAGDAPVVKTKIATVSGGVTFAGGGVYNKSKIWLVSGGIVLAGDAPRNKGKVPVLSGGYVLSGTAQIVRTKVAQSSGEVSLSGNAATLFEPGDTDPIQIRSRTFGKWHRSFN
jgi:hypothetical protein